MYNEDKKIAVIVGVIVAILLTVMGSTKIIRQGEVGVVTRLGRATGREMDAGLNLKIPFIEGVVRMDTKIQKVDVEGINAGSKDLQTVNIDAVINYHINKEDASDIFSNFQDDDQLYEKVIAPAIQESTKSVVSKYKAEEILTKREEVKQLLDTQLKERLAKYWVYVDDISITNVTFSAEFDAAIEAKQVAEQEAQKAKYEAEKAITQKQAEVDKAKLDVEKAKAEAEQNKVQSQQLTDEILEKMWIEKWNGVLPTVVSDSSGIMYNLNVE